MSRKWQTKKEMFQFLSKSFHSMAFHNFTRQGVPQPRAGRTEWPITDRHEARPWNVQLVWWRRSQTSRDRIGRRAEIRRTARLCVLCRPWYFCCCCNRSGSRDLSRDSSRPYNRSPGATGRALHRSFLSVRFFPRSRSRSCKRISVSPPVSFPFFLMY